MIIFLRAPGKGKLPGILGIGRTEDESMLWRPGVDQQGNQLAGAVPGEDKVRRDPAVCGQNTAQRGIIPVRVGRKNIQVRCKRFLYGIRQPQRVDICPEIGDVFLIQMIVLTDFLNIASVKNRSCIHVLPFLS